MNSSTFVSLENGVPHQYHGALSICQNLQIEFDVVNLKIAVNVDG